MRVLHVCNDFCGSKVHCNLYRELDASGAQQTVYTYFRSPGLHGRNIFEARKTEFVFSRILRPVHRVLYHKKIHDVYQDLKSRLSLASASYDLVHATTLFSDGALALRILKEFGIPYIVSVRNTDINDFLVYAPHTWFTGIRVLRSATKIVFISKALKEKFCRHPLVKAILPSIEDRFIIQPNGIDSYWLDNVSTRPVSENNHNVLFVGHFDRNKNVMRLCRVVVSMKKRFPDIQLHLVGSGPREKMLKNKAEKYPGTIFLHGEIHDKRILQDVYSRCSVFAMPSFHETFGLVYLEALSQHLAIIYTKGQGIDGMLDSRVGEAVNAASVSDMRLAIGRILTDRQRYLASEVVDFSLFRWDRIASRYMELYEHCIAMQ